MNFAPSDEQAEVRELAATVFADAREGRLRGPEMADVLWARVVETDLAGVTVPAEHGGAGLGLVELCEVFVELGRAGVDLPLLGGAGLAATLVAFGEEEQRGRWLPEIASGRLTVALATAERHGGDPEEARTTARRDGDAWVLNGEKILVAFAQGAGLFVVPARVDDEVAVFLVEPGAAGLARTEEVDTTGSQRQALVLDEVRVGRNACLGDPGLYGSRPTALLRRHAETLLCAYQVGLADGGLRMAASYTSQRRQFNRPIATFQAVAMRAADSYIDLDAMRWTMYEAALALATDQEAEEQVAVAKWWAAEAGHRILGIALDLHGGLGVDLDYPIHRYFLNGKQAQLAFGGGGPQLERLWRALVVRTEAAA